MSFSSDVKTEIAEAANEARHCRIAELAAVINACGIVSDTGEGFRLTLQADSEAVCNRAVKIIRDDFGGCAVMLRQQAASSKKGFCNATVQDPQVNRRLLWATGLLSKDEDKLVFHINQLVIKSDCCKRAFIRASFLLNGSISDPAKGYHLEFVFTTRAYADEFSCLIHYFGLNSKVVARKDYFVVYLKEGEQIVDLLNIMGAHKSLLALENLRIEKDIYNNINRKINFQSANLNKTINASVKQVEDIHYISHTKGLTFLSPGLEELARLRIEYPEISLKELGEKLSVPLGKSGVNHRLRKISVIADALRSDDGIPGG